MKTLIIGKGEIGTALQKILSKAHDVYIRDIEDLDIDGIEVLHICYPDHDGFIENTKKYIEKYKPKVTIINSSISVGTTEKIGDGVVYSPVRGRHPKLEAELTIFEKGIYGGTQADRSLAKEHFTSCGMKVDSDYTLAKGGELVKLLSNIHLGIEIAWRQEISRILKNFGVPEIYYEWWEKTYREGYFASNDRHLLRPSMQPNPIGGHCILPCLDILKNQYPSKVFDFVIESNEKRKGEQNG